MIDGQRRGFELTRPTAVEIYAVGELRRDDAFDYGWIVNADTRKRIWSELQEGKDPESVRAAVALEDTPA